MIIMKRIILCAISVFFLFIHQSQSQTFTRIDFMLTLSDGIKLDCSKYIPNGTPPAGGWPVMIVTHGYGLSKYSEMEEAEEYASLGFYSLVYSMRGQGISEGQSNFISTIEANDLKQVVTYIKNDANTNDNKIGIHGGSQGGIIPLMAVCTGMQVKTIIPDMASPEQGTNWIENGGIKMTFLWTCSYPPNIVRYNPTVSRFKSWMLSGQKDKWDSLAYYLPINRDFLNQVTNCQIPVLITNCWQDKFFNALGMIKSAYILPYNNYKMYYGVTAGHGSDYIPAEETFKEGVFGDWIDFHLLGIQNNIMDVSRKFTYTASRFPVGQRNSWTWQRFYSPTWPPAGITNTKLYFHPNGKLELGGYSGPITDVNFVNDVLDTNVTMEYLVNTEFRGPVFESKFQKRELIFETNPLTQNATMAGTPYAGIYYSSTANLCQYNIQVWEIQAGGLEKLVTRINWTDRNYTPNQTRQKYVNGQAYSHIFSSGSRIRVKITNLDNVPLITQAGDTTDYFLRTNPFMLPVLKRGTNKMFVNGASGSYIELPIMNLAIGIQQISTEIPGSFLLKQNYPNPFNPVTKIRFEVPSTGKNNFVTIKIFDITGREISTIVDDNFNPGIYEVDWDGSKYSSGAYFYRMQAGEFTAIKKMILVK
jgi:predicted acyl esterase